VLVLMLPSSCGWLLFALRSPTMERQLSERK
jgi:hypothetical protein